MFLHDQAQRNMSELSAEVDIADVFSWHIRLLVM